MNKKFHIKLTKDFFKRDGIRWLLKIPGGGFFVNLYLEMLTVAVNSNGHLTSSADSRIMIMFEDELAVDFGVSLETMVLAVKLFREHGLLEVKGKGDYFLKDAVELRHEDEDN